MIDLEQVPLATWLWLAGGLAAVAAVGYGLLYYRRWRARRAIAERIEAVAVATLADVALPDGNGGWFHLDFLLLTPSGLVVIDMRDVTGLVFGSEQMTEWTVMQKTWRYTFANPLGPLYDRIAIVRMIAGDGAPVTGRVVFTDRGSFPKGHPPNVTRLASIAGEFPALDRTLAETAAAPFRPAWDRLAAAAIPSPLRRR